MEKLNVFRGALILGIAICILSSCHNHNNSTNKKLWAERARSTTYFKVDTLSEADQPWSSISKSMDKKKIIKTLFDAVISGKTKAYDVFFNPDSVLQPEFIKRMIVRIDTVEMEDPDTRKMI